MARYRLTPALAATALAFAPLTATAHAAAALPVTRTTDAALVHPDHAAIVARMEAMYAIHFLPIPVLQQRAATGDLRAIYALSLKYQNGLGVKQSWPEYERLSKRILQIAPALAEQGDPYAMYQLAFQRWLAEQWTDDRKFAAYLAAAEAGDPEAAAGVGQAYDLGRGVRADRAEALRWYVRAATAGHCDSMTKIGYLLSDPKTGAVDVAEAVRWYRMAAENPVACGNGANYALALLFSEGRGNLPRDYGQALRWFLETARRGNPVGAMQIGFYYEKGLGTPVNRAEALRWFKIAGFPSVAAARAEMARLRIKEPG
ncbi:MULTISPECIES: tetratricopeptide repeat protein [unclassified Sphingomonas]|uniref:tetratricopeptide repeat protein n=1 Tax=unclassified Sphingomonas TaxID=196159 RepID=UPI002150F66A|nr:MULTISPECIES: tetratricopeptide repeat protein [unclassified Sphingomonas]MCR5870181.1 sel1 repeat family protein [Sphingomonas sp. J344]UUX98128.1 sel1 repeat family protein [Sphingomonas sp. J315]